MNKIRKLVYKFFSLPHHKRLKIAKELSLFKNGDEKLIDPNFNKLFFKRIAKKKYYDKLWEKLNE